MAGDWLGPSRRVPRELICVELERGAPGSTVSQQITFEPRHRNTIGSAGRIDVYSYPEMHEAMLLRAPNIDGADGLTQEGAERLVGETPWTAYSQERMPLRVDLSSDEGVSRFFEDLVAKHSAVQP